MLGLFSNKKTFSNLTSEQAQIVKAKKYSKAFGPIYEAYYEDAFRFVFQRIGDKTETAEILSDVFFKAMNKIGSFNPTETSIKYWILTIARNEMFTRFRKGKNQMMIQYEESDLQSIIDEVEEERITFEAVLSLLESLSDEELDLIEMRFFEQRSFKEIAALAGLSESNAKVRVHRIIKRLQKKID